MAEHVDDEAGLSDALLREIEARCALATSGPWQAWYEHVGSADSLDFQYLVSSGTGDRPVDIADVRTGRADADFIAHARADVEVLLAEVNRLRSR